MLSNCAVSVNPDLKIWDGCSQKFSGKLRINFGTISLEMFKKNGKMFTNNNDVFLSVCE